MDRIAEPAIRKRVVALCQFLHQKNWLAAADGNVSYRFSDERIVITPTGRAKARLQPEDLAVINIHGHCLQGAPSSEYSMHLTVYRKCIEASAVVHAHPPTAIAWSIAHPELSELPAEGLSELILAVGRIPFIPYARPGSAEMGSVLEPFLPTHRVCILSRHGALSWGEDLEEAVHGIERLEHTAEILLRAKQLGRLTVLPPEEVAALRAIRATLGDKTR